MFCKGGEDGRGTDGGGGRTKTRIARPKHIIKSCVKMHMNSNIHNEFPAPFSKFFSVITENFFFEIFNFLDVSGDSEQLSKILKMLGPRLVNVRSEIG